MKAKSMLATTLLSIVLTSPAVVLACGDANSTTHVGNLMAIDQNANSFTILDAQSGTPIAFIASDEIMQDLNGVRGIIQVDFEKTADSLHAIAVRY